MNTLSANWSNVFDQQIEVEDTLHVVEDEEGEESEINMLNDTVSNNEIEEDESDVIESFSNEYLSSLPKDDIKSVAIVMYYLLVNKLLFPLT